MNILYGLAVPDEGTVLLDGTEVQIEGPSDAIRRGISMVHQHFMLVPVLTVADNILLGAEVMANPVFLDRAGANRRIRELAAQFGFDIDPDARVVTPNALPGVCPSSSLHDAGAYCQPSR
jgi:simple sugar transport system ATP-binding protein